MYRGYSPPIVCDPLIDCTRRIIYLYFLRWIGSLLGLLERTTQIGFTLSMNANAFFTVIRVFLTVRVDGSTRSQPGVTPRRTCDQHALELSFECRSVV
jgi:hypothetical protein